MTILGADRMRTWSLLTDAAGAAAAALVGTFLVAAPCWASGPLDRLLACRRIAEITARVACFDRESAVLANLPRMPAPVTSERCAPAPRAAVADAQPTRGAAPVRRASLDPQQTFGLPPMKILAEEESAQRLPHQLDSITAHIVAVSHAADGRDVFTLDNQEVWAQLVPDGDFYARPGETVKISKALLGSYWLALSSRRGGCKVMRVR